ncbi:phage tail assembly protein [Nevskia sp.]|uniref:phage tail assembly protein n=1 Tax=Nevskia sp. TaxID=1929292 RepID=UPI0025FF7FD1|nr:phage tail assembly protein [Nevskia sp.]
MQTIKGKLKKGLKIGDKLHFNFELREPSNADVFDAEDEHGIETPLKFNTAVVARILVRIDDYTGPFTFSMIRGLSRFDLKTLTDAMREAEKLGEA